MADSTIRQNIQNLLINLEGRRASLVQLSGSDMGKTYEFKVTPITIGRSPECTIMVDEEQVSREHARIIQAESGFMIFDLNSTNGTLVNGSQIKEHLLQDGDRVQIGNLTVFKFNFQDELDSTFNEELYNSANRDYLTQVYNKKYLIDRLRMEFSFAKRHNTKLALIMFDIDRFKNVNDQHGHLLGDEVLKQVCDRVGQSKREEDVFARFGGEEFVLMLREADSKTAYLMAEKMRKVVEEKPFCIDGKDVTITISLGVTGLDESQNSGNGSASSTPNNSSNTPPNTIDEFLLQVDNQLYRAKREGRNRTCL